jgi:CHAT domain-containing protein
MWAGLEGPLARARRVIVAPDGPVHLVPFAALAGTERTTPPSIVGVPSATVLAGIRREAPARSAPHGLLACAPADRSLEGARREVQWLAQQFRDVATAASDTLELSDLAGYDALHLAGHSIVDDQFPWRSAIGASARANGASLPDSSAGRPGPLRAETIASGHLDARLVVLSSCATAGGRVLTGEGVAGLSTAFLAAGTPTVLATLWPVDDRATERFMKEFYRGLGRGQGADAALAMAQERFRRDPATRHPFYWAGFVVLGEGDTRVALRPRPLASIGPWVAMGVGVLLGATLLLGRTRRRPSA